VGADDLSVADDPAFSRTPFLRAKSLKVKRRAGASYFLEQTQRNRTHHRRARDRAASIRFRRVEFFQPRRQGSVSAPAAAPAAPTKAGLDLSAKLVKIAAGRRHVAKEKKEHGCCGEIAQLDIHFSITSGFECCCHAHGEGAAGDLHQLRRTGRVRPSWAAAGAAAGAALTGALAPEAGKIPLPNRIEAATISGRRW